MTNERTKVVMKNLRSNYKRNMLNQVNRNETKLSQTGEEENLRIKSDKQTILIPGDTSIDQRLNSSIVYGSSSVVKKDPMAMEEFIAVGEKKIRLRMNSTIFKETQKQRTSRYGDMTIQT